MGHRNPDRVPITARFSRGRTVADMARERWDVVSQCDYCGLMMKADLRLIAYVSGPNTVLWNRKAKCRLLFCRGVVTFLAQAPGMDGHQVLAIDPRIPEDWASAQAKSLRATAPKREGGA